MNAEQCTKLGTHGTHVYNNGNYICIRCGYVFYKFNNLIDKKLKMKYCKILVNITMWHLIPYKLDLRPTAGIIEYGFLCFKLIITNK